MWLINVSFLQLLSGERALLSSGKLYMCFNDMKAQGLFAHCNKKDGKHFSLPSLPFGSTFISRMAGVPSPLLG